MEVYIKQYQIDIQSMKARMDIMMRYTWRVKPFVNPHDMTSHHQDMVRVHYLLIIKFLLANIMDILDILNTFNHILLT